MVFMRVWLLVEIGELGQSSDKVFTFCCNALLMLSTVATLSFV